MHRSLGREPPSIQGSGATDALSLARRVLGHVLDALITDFTGKLGQI